MELRHLRYFVAVAAHGSFNRASKILHLSQPAVSHQVRELEEEIGVPLLVRGKNAIRLTPAGEAFYEEAREVIARAEQAVRHAQGEKAADVLRVGYLPTLVYGILSRALERFQTVRPRVRVELSELRPLEMVEAAREGRVDLLVILEDQSVALSGFHWSELRPFAIALVISAQHPLARLQWVKPARIGDLPLIGLGKTLLPGYPTRVRKDFRPFGVTPKFIQLVNDLSSAFTEAEAKQAGVILAETVETMLPRGLVMRRFKPAVAIRRILLGVPADRPNHNAEIFGDFLRQAAAPEL